MLVFNFTPYLGNFILYYSVTCKYLAFCVCVIMTAFIYYLC